MNIEILPLVSFVIITTFSPGPNNISSASMGILYGYRKTVNFLLGIACGFFAVMIGCAFLSSALLSLLPASETYLRGIGALYILWLAFSILRSDIVPGESKENPKAFIKGFVLQLFNPKVAVYGLTLFSTFLASAAHKPDLLALFAMIFALTAFTATSFWAVCGAAIKARLRNDTFRKNINRVLALMLACTAVDLSGIWAAL